MTLVQLRQRHKFTQEQLGLRIGVSQRSIASYENGNRKPSPLVANKIREEFSLTEKEIWDMFYADSATPPETNQTA